MAERAGLLRANTAALLLTGAFLVDRSEAVAEAVSMLSLAPTIIRACLFNGMIVDV